MSQQAQQSSIASAAAPLVGIVVVNWNGWQDTLLSYEYVQRSTHENWMFIVVDNASSDDSVERLRRSDAKYRLIESPTNLGFAGGCNLGIAEAKALGADYIYLLNPDAFVSPTTLAELVASSQKLDDRAVLGTTIRYDFGNALQFWGSKTSPLIGLPLKFGHSEYNYCRAPDFIESEFIIGASLFASRAVVDRVGDFDDRFFLNYEETDWCFRAKRAGFPSYVVKSALVRHKGGASLGDARGPLQTYFIRRNRVLFAEKHCAPHQFVIVLGHQVSRSLALLLRFLFDHRPSSAAWRMVAKADFRATLDYVLRRFGDCPPIIRKMAGDYRAAKAQAHAAAAARAAVATQPSR